MVMWEQDLFIEKVSFTKLNANNEFTKTLKFEKVKFDITIKIR